MGNSATCTCGSAPQTPEQQQLVVDIGPLLNGLDTWDFHALQYDSEQLGIACLVLLQAAFAACGGQNQDALPCFICCVRDGYLPNPYHNFAHAVDVLQTILRLGTLMPWDAVLSPVARFAVLIAGLAHDIGHPGFSNVFLIDADHELAHRYNDVSPLENMHCSRLLELVGLEHCAIFGHLAKKEFLAMRKLMIDAILRTDVLRQGDVLAELHGFLKIHAETFDGQSTGADLPPEQVKVLSTEEGRRLLARVLVLGADQSNQAKPWSAAYSWAEVLREEMIAQGDRERSLGLAVPALHDRCAMSLPEAMLGAMQLLSTPLLAAEVRLFPRWGQLAANMSSNIRQWCQRLSTEDFHDFRHWEQRVNKVHEVLGNARILESLPDASSKLEACGLRDSHDEAAGTEPCSEPSCPEVPAAPLVREIRRWRENQMATGQQRELVLLYVISDETGGPKSVRGQPILFRYMVQTPDGPTPIPTPIGVPAGGAMSSTAPPRGSLPPLPLPPVSRGLPAAPSGDFGGRGVAATPAATPPLRDGPRTPLVSECVLNDFFSEAQPAQAWSDSVCRELDNAKFETLLGACLEDFPDVLNRHMRCSNLDTTGNMSSGQAKRSSYSSVGFRSFIPGTKKDSL